MSAYETRTVLLVLVSVAAAITLFFVGPIPQDPGYHLFADDRTIAGVKHFWNVVSNLAFLVAGGLGLLRFTRLSHEESRTPYLVMCTGAMLIGLGSAYYHDAPTNSTLLWDRLPMTVAFMALFSMLLSERVVHAGRRPLLWFLVAIGAASVIYWSWTESRGMGDLRPYALVQYLPFVLMPLIVFLYPPRYLSNRLLLAAFGLYLVAKLFEHFDGPVFAATGFMSGHAMKHVAAAVAVLCLVYAVPVRLPGRRTAG